MVVIVKILLVEEHHDLAESIEKLLEAKGHNVIWASICKNAVQLIAKTKFDVVITNIEIADCSKYCIIDELEKDRRINNETKVIALFARKTPDEIKAYTNRGVSFCFSMPVTPEVLVEAIDSFSQ